MSEISGLSELKLSSVGIFVYGTLKKNQLRGSVWPKTPAAIDHAVTFGELWDLGSYPGLRTGSDRVLGELWTFHPNDIEETFGVLDQIEGYDALEDRGLYLRRQIQVRRVVDQDHLGEIQNAFTYLIPGGVQTPRMRRIKPWKEVRWIVEGVQIDELAACWPDHESFVPQDPSEEDV